MDSSGGLGHGLAQGQPMDWEQESEPENEKFVQRQGNLSMRFVLERWRRRLQQRRRVDAEYSASIYAHLTSQERCAMKTWIRSIKERKYSRETGIKCDNLFKKNAIMRGFSRLLTSGRDDIDKPRRFRRLRILSTVFGEWRRTCIEEINLSISSCKRADEWRERRSKRRGISVWSRWSDRSYQQGQRSKVGLVFRVLWSLSCTWRRWSRVKSIEYKKFHDPVVVLDAQETKAQVENFNLKRLFRRMVDSPGRELQLK